MEAKSAGAVLPIGVIDLLICSSGPCFGCIRSGKRGIERSCALWSLRYGDFTEGVKKDIRNI